MAVATQKIVIHADDKTGAAIASAIRNSKKLEKQVSSTGKAMRNTTRQSRAQLGQVGHQIQDIAVMYQMGMNPMLILGQQGSQLAGIFGTSGALFGGVVAIAAVVGQQLAPAFFSSANAAKELEEANEKVARVMDKMEDGVLTLTDKIKKLALVNKELAMLEVSMAMTEAKIAFAAASDQIVESVDKQLEKWHQFGISIDTVKGAYAELDRLKSPDLSVGAKDAYAVRMNMAKLAKATELVQNAIENLSGNLGISEDKSKKLLEALMTLGDAQTVEGINNARTAFLELADGEDLSNKELRNLITTLTDASIAALENKEAYDQLNLMLSNNTLLVKANADARDKALESFLKEAEARQKLQDIIDSIAQTQSKERIKLIEEGKSANQKFIEEAERLQAVLRRGNSEMSGTELDAYRVAIEKLAGTLFKTATITEKTAKKTKELKMAQDETLKMFEDQGVRAAKSFEDALIGIADGSMTAKDAFKQMAVSILRDMLRMQLKTATSRLAGLATSALTAAFFPGGTTSATMGAAGVSVGTGGFTQGMGPSMSGPGRAMGGPVSGGKPYMVGERGPELMIPTGGGKVVPNNRLGGSDGVSVTLNISTGVSQTVRAEIANLMPQITNATKAGVLQARQRGGSYSKGLTGI